MATDQTDNPYSKYATPAAEDNPYAKYLPGYKDPKEDQSDLWAGLKTSFKQLPELGWGLAAITAAGLESATGEGGLATAAKKFSVGKMMDAQKSVQADQRDIYDANVAWDKAVKDGDFGALADWAQYAVGYGVGQGLQVLGTAGLGKLGAQALLKPAVEKYAEGLVAKEATTLAAKQLGEGAAAADVAALASNEAVKKAAVRNVAGSIGGHAATGAYSFGMEGGEIGGDLAKKSVDENRSLTGSELARGLGATLMAGSLEYGENLLSLGGLKGKLPTPFAETTGVAGRLGRAAVGSAIAAPVEGATEYFQTGLENYGKGQEENILPWNQSEASQKDAINSAAMGAVGGATHATVGGLISGARTAPAPNPDAGLNQSLDQLQAARDAVYLGGPSGAQTAANVLSAPDVDTAIANMEGSSPSMSQIINEKKGAYLAPLMDRQAELTQQANAAGTSFDRQSALNQAAVSLEQNLPARQGTADQYADLAPMDERTARGRLKVLRDMTANEGGDALSLEIVPHPGVEGKFAIGRGQATPSLELPAQQPAALAPAEVQQRLETAAAKAPTDADAMIEALKVRDTGQVVGSQLLDMLSPGDKAAYSDVLRAVEARGGKATPLEAALLNRVNPGAKNYDSIVSEPVGGEQLRTLRALTQNINALGDAQQQGKDAAREQLRLRALGLAEPNVEAPAQPLVVDSGARQREPGRENRLQRLNSWASENASDARMAELAGQRQAQQDAQNQANEAAAAKQPVAPTVDQTIAALRTIPALRTAEQKATASAAMARMTPDQYSLLQRAATMPQGLSSEERVQLRGMRAAETTTPTSGTTTPTSGTTSGATTPTSGTTIPTSGTTTPTSGTTIPTNGTTTPTSGTTIPTNGTTSGATTPTAKASEQRTEATQQGKPVSTLGNITVVDPATLSTQSRTADGTISRQTHRMVSLIGSMFGKKVVLFSSDNDMAPDGFVRTGDSRTIHLNVKSQVSHLVVFGHELLHQAKADNPNAYNALAKVIKLKEGADTNVAGIRGDMEELTADVVGNRFRETEFWHDVFREILASGTDTKVSQRSAMRLGASVVRAVDKMVKALKGMTGFNTDNMVSNLQEVRGAVTKALASYAQEKRGEATELIRNENATRQEPQQGSVQQERGQGNAGRQAAEAGTGNRVLGAAQSTAAEGEAGQGVRASQKRGQLDNIEAYHYSQRPRTTLSSSTHGAGLQDANREQFQKAADKRLRERIYFYVDKGAGIFPLPGLGGHAHRTTLDNVYDMNADPQGLRKGKSLEAFESAVLDAGFDGYLDRRAGTQAGVVIMLGQRTMPVEYLGTPGPIRSGSKLEPVDSEAPVWTTQATGTRQEMDARVARMRTTIGWRGYDIRVVPGAGGAAIQTRPIPEPEVKASDKRALPGAPDVEGATGPDPRIVSVAEQYARANGIDLKRQARYVHVDVARAQAIADAWEEVEDNPNDPRTRRAYDALARQTMDQYMALEKAGYKFWFYDGNTDPYKENPWNAMRQLRDEQKMAVFSTKAGYGNKFNDSLAKQSPMLAETGLYWSMGSEDGPKQPVLFNDLFRAVHDAFGHGIEGAGFRGRGEENAWQAHVRLFTGDAIAALTSETRGQNSWLNYGPYGLHNRTAKIQDVIFADQKTGLMPSWTWTEGRAGDMPEEDIKFAAKRPGPTRPVRQEVADAADISNARQIATSRTWATNRDFKLALQNVVRAAARTIDLSVDTPEARAYITRQLLKEAREALITNANAVGWYDEKVTTALEVVSEIHPELKTDERSRFAFIWALAVTSNGVKVNKNFELAERAYSQWKASNTDPAKRVMPTSGIGVGTAAGKIHEGLATYNDLTQRWGYSRLREFSTTLQPNRQVANAFGRKVSGEGMDTMVYGAGILGPKIGNGFFMNLFGEFGQLTMDRWWVRMWGRMTGDLVEIDPNKIRTSREAFVSIIDMIKGDRDATRAVEQAIGSRLGKGDPVEMAKVIMRATNEKSVRDALAEILPATPEREAAIAAVRGNARDFVSVADELRKAAKSFYVNLDGQIEVPGGSRRRDMMRAVSQQVLSELQKENPHLTMADFQALMWYPEKTLYDSAGAQSETSEEGYEDDEAPDYANAAITLAREKKVPNERINAAVERARSDIASRQRSGRSGRATGDVSAQDRNGARATPAAPQIQEVRPSEKRSELVSIFKGLQSGRGLALIRAQEMVANHPNGDAITKINDDFYDILGRLEDEGAIRINCK